MDLTHKIIQWNCRSITSKKSDLIYLINKHKPCIIALSETWLKPNTFFRISGYTCVRHDQSNGYKGTAILIKNPIPYTAFPLPSHSNDFSMTAIISNNICFISIYIPFPTSDIMSCIDNIISNIPKPFMILGDLNSHHPSWGCSLNKNYGENLLNIIDKHNLCILNTGAPTRRTTPEQNISAIDLSICTPELALKLSWEVLPSTYGSDHFPILISSSHNILPTPDRPKSTVKYRTNIGDWKLFKNLAEQKINLLTDIQHGHEQTALIDLTEALTAAADQVFPTKQNNMNRIPSPPWWDHDCSIAIKKRKEAEKLYKRSMSNENYLNLSNICKETKKLLRSKKLDGWKKFCLSIDPNTNSSLVWNNIKRFRSAITKNTSKYIPPSLAGQFLDNLAPPYVPEQIRLSFNNDYQNIRHSNLDQPFSLFELKAVLSRLKDSTPGQDNIPYSFLVNLSDISLTYYLKLINSIIKSGNIPTQWKTQLILPILKPEKPSSSASSYRAIILSSVLGKVAEHLIKNRLEWFVETNSLLSPSQYGFRKGKGTLDNLSIFITDIQKAFTENKVTIAAFLDISSAYDKVIIPILYRKLLQLKVPKQISNYIYSLFSERKIVLNVNETEYNDTQRTTWRGLPQGSVLSPLLYNIYTADLETVFGSTIQVLQYADDLLLYTTNNTPAEAASQLNIALEALKYWLDDNGFEISVPKSSVLVFSRMRSPPNICVKLSDLPIPIKKQAKFLGVILDDKLTGLPHCDYLVAKCEKQLNVLRCLTGVWWGSHPYNLKLLYNAIIRSTIEYATFLLSPILKSGLKKLECLQSKALRIVTGAMKSSPINALQIECSDPPLNLRLQYLSDKFFFRCLQFLHHPLINKIQLLDDQIPNSKYWSHKPNPYLVVSFKRYLVINAPTYRSRIFPLFESNFNALMQTPEIVKHLNITKNHPNAKSLFKFTTDNNWKNWNHLFTDASKTSPSGCVGIGVYHVQYNIVQKIKLPPETSVFTGELFGILRAVEYISLMKLKKSVIFSDSLSALQLIEKCPYNMKKPYPVIIQLRNLLFKCSTMNYSVIFVWIPSHSGIKGNEKADSIAKEAVECGDIVPFTNFCHDLENIPKKSLYGEWNKQWLETQKSKGKLYSILVKNIDHRPWFFNIKLNKIETSVIIRMRLGHHCAPVHLAKLKVIDSDACICGTGVGDLNHIFFSCPLFDHSSFFTNLIILKVPLPTSVTCLLYDCSVNVYKLLSKFIKENNIKI